MYRECDSKDKNEMIKTDLQTAADSSDKKANLCVCGGVVAQGTLTSQNGSQAIFVKSP